MPTPHWAIGFLHVLDENEQLADQTTALAPASQTGRYVVDQPVAERFNTCEAIRLRSTS